MRRVALLAVAAGLAACQPQPSARASQAPPPPGTDGRYRGTARLIRAESRYCPRSGSRVLEVYSGQITLSYSDDAPRSRVPLTAQVGGDGHIQASDGIGTMEGELHDGQLGVTIASRTCEHRWTLTKVN